MADDSRNVQQHHLPRRQQQYQKLHSSYLEREKSKNRPGLKNGVKVQSTSASSCIIILEEEKDLPIFWNGENPTMTYKWGPFPDEKEEPQFATICDFLATYVADNYLRRCTMSLQASSTKYINNLRMSDPFSKILDHQGKEGKPVTLMLKYANVEDGESGYSKFTLSIREVDNKKVLWDGNLPTSKMVAKLNQSDMSLTLEKCLQNYVAKGYLSQDCQVDHVKESSDIKRVPGGEELHRISTTDLVNTLFKGNSATIAIRKVANSPSTAIKLNDQNRDDSETNQQNPFWTSIPTFLEGSTPSEWLSKNWADIREEVRVLIYAIELTMRDRVIPADVYAGLVEKKNALELAIRRRVRSVDEVWRCYTSLRNVHNDILNSNTVTDQAGTSSVLSVFETPGHSIHSIITERPSSSMFDGDRVIQRRSCLDFLSSTLIRCGMELEFFDNENQGLNRMTGVGLGIAVLVAICSFVYYF
ncbi:Dynein heavy chain 14, axonemal [Orchesella cincta]|uniref:Dynein heavy chain 14, axonemal n=1 Tax=Orchesella cincta TaxID=48709 RepID=A0A1D2MM20_ORCCI|nr:Dynein heavy chain 14, axonemal [Orchesella cincta]